MKILYEMDVLTYIRIFHTKKRKKKLVCCYIRKKSGC